MLLSDCAPEVDNYSFQKAKLCCGPLKLSCTAVFEFTEPKVSLEAHIPQFNPAVNTEEGLGRSRSPRRCDSALSSHLSSDSSSAASAVAAEHVEVHDLAEAAAGAAPSQEFEFDEAGADQPAGEGGALF